MARTRSMKNVDNTMTHYSKQRRLNDPTKSFCNDSLVRCYERYIGESHGNVFVLDDAGFGSTNAISKQFPFLNIKIAQNDKNEFDKMKSKKIFIIHDDYSALDKLVPDGSVVIDNADFCCGWVNVRDTILNRLRSKIYADRAILRLTVSARGSKKTMDDFTSDILCELYQACFDTEYSIKPLTIRQWVPDDAVEEYGFQKEHMNATSYTYFPSMVTFILLIT